MIGYSGKQVAFQADLEGKYNKVSSKHGKPEPLGYERKCLEDNFVCLGPDRRKKGQVGCIALEGISIN